MDLNFRTEETPDGLDAYCTVDGCGDVLHFTPNATIAAIEADMEEHQRLHSDQGE